MRAQKRAQIPTREQRRKMRAVPERWLIGMLCGKLWSRVALDRRYDDEPAIPIAIRASRATEDNRPFANAIRLAALVRAAWVARVAVAAVVWMLVNFMRAFQCCRVRRAHPAAFPAFKQRAGQHKCCQDGGSQRVSDHAATSSNKSTLRMILGRMESTVKKNRRLLAWVERCAFSSIGNPTSFP